MIHFFKKYRERITLQHGWEVPLKCSKCGHEGKPRYKGWKPSYAMRFGKKATIYADLFCSNCGASLKEEAAEKLVRIFSEVAIPRTNRKMLIAFLIMLTVPLLAMVFLGGKGHFVMVGILVFLGPAILFFNYHIASIRYKCPCGNPRYLFMGLLGRSYCHRCSSCGQLLRLRD